MGLALIFPGQGSQAVGMGKALADAFSAAREVFAEVDMALGQNLSQIMWEGPEEVLTLTENAQPAIMAVSLAVVRVLEKEHAISLGDVARFVAGHSLGEYSALAATGVITLSDAARLLKIRGQAMQMATPVGTGAMAALLGLDLADAVEVANAAAQGDVCQAANDNAPGQVVVSGHKAAIERAVEIAKARGAKRAILLQVSAPFHCALMRPAAEAMRAALSDVALRKPAVPVVANVTATPTDDPATIRERLIEQVTGTVRWRESMGYMAGQGVKLFCELGAGKVLTGLVKRNAPEAAGLTIGAPADFINAVAQIKQG